MSLISILSIAKPFIHYGMHWVIPMFISRVYYPHQFIRSAFILLMGNMVDIDHLWAMPMYAPYRCSIGFHTFHQLIPIIIYGILLLPAKTRIFAIGLLWHMLTDTVDCGMSKFILWH